MTGSLPNGASHIRGRVLNSSPHIYGRISTGGTIVGRISIPQNLTFEIYSGEYAITPQTYSPVEMETAGRVMRNNVTIERIPQFEVSNESGGSTLIIGEEYFTHA